MKIVIDIPNHVYESIMNMRGNGSLFEEAVKEGTPLPKGHGRLIDENEIKSLIENAKVNSENNKTFAENIIKFAPTIIDADKERD